MMARKKIDKSSISWANMTGSERISHVMRLHRAYTEDAKKADRLEDAKCLVCYYSQSRIGGAAMTTVNCGICNVEMHYGSTAVDAVCHGCAKKNGLCRQCGADVELKNRRKQYPFEKEAMNEKKANPAAATITTGTTATTITTTAYCSVSILPKAPGTGC